MKVTGKKAEDGSMVPGSIRFQATGDADITLFGEAASDETSIEAENTAITNHGKISKGSYKARKALHVYNAKGGTISGGTFTGADTTLTNEADLSGAKVEGTKTLIVMNAASIQNATLTGGAAKVDNHGKGSVMKDVTLTGSTITLTNEGTVENGSHTAETGAMTIRNSGKLSAGAYTAKADAMGITNEGTIENGTYTAETDAMTITNRGKLSSGTYTAKGTMDITNEGTVENGSYTTETGAMTITNRGKLSSGMYTAKAGTMDITNEGTIENGTYTARGDLTYTDIAKSSLTDGTLISEEGKSKITAHGVFRLKKLSAKDSATVEADHDVTLTEAEAGTLAVSSGGSVNAGTLTATTGDAKVKAKTNVTIGTLTAETGGTTIEATDGALDVTTLNAKSLTAKAGTTLSATTLDVKEHAELTSGSDMVLTEAHANTLTANAGGKLTATTLGVTGAAGLTSGGAMEVTEATVGSVAAKAGTTLHVKKLTSTGEATLTSKDEATLDDVTAGTLAAESTAGSVKAGTLTATTGDASVTAKKDVTIGTLKAKAGNATIEATDGALDVTTLNAKSLTAKAGTTLSATTLDVKEHAELTSGDDMVLTEAHANTLTANAGGKLTATTLGVTGAAGLTSGGAMEVSEATVGSVMANAGSTLHVKKLTSTGEATLTSKEEAKLDDVTAGTLAAESTAGSVNAGTLTAKTGDAKVTAKTDATIGTLKAEAGSATVKATEGKLDVTTLNAKEHAALSSGGAMTLESASADTLTAKAGTTLDVTKIHTAGDASLVSGSNMALHEAEVGGKLTADAGGSISVKGTDAKISGSTIEMTAKEDIRITDRSPVGKLDGVDTSVSAGSTTGSGAAGSLVTGEAKPHDFDASGKGSALLSSAGGKLTLSAKKVEIDTLKNGEGNAADLTISADNIGIDDLAGTGAQHVTIHGKDGQSQAHYAGIHSTAEGGTLVKDSAVEHLELTGREPLGLSNTAIGGDSLLATDKIRVTIQKNPGSSMAEHFGNLSLNGYDIATDHVMTSVKDGVTVNGERFPVTAESVMNASLYEDRTLGRDGREKEEETEKDSPSLAFGAPNDKEAYEVVK